MNDHSADRLGPIHIRTCISVFGRVIDIVAYQRKVAINARSGWRRLRKIYRYFCVQDAPKLRRPCARTNYRRYSGRAYSLSRI